jgi:glycosyltransferase involved in cell wall biosynthesis
MMQRAPNILYLDYLPFSQVITLMRTARAVAFPSLYEGFGLPILEAYVCGAPAITSDVGATAEVAGDGALLVDPYDVGALRDALRRLSAAGDPDGALRARLVAAGRARAADFDEAVIARRLAAFHDVVAAAPIRLAPSRAALRADARAGAGAARAA